ncbi:MAG: hypothetical protein HQK83_05870 [Fibrobacteria bacterium]|nr:hypothetical protein [Fibrobacteria bacterium]
MYRIRMLLALMIACWFGGCFFTGEDEKVAGDGGGTEVVGVIYQEDGITPARGAIVEVRQAGENPLSVALAKNTSSQFLVASYTTERDGKFVFRDLEPGFYNIKSSLFIDTGTSLVHLFYKVNLEEQKLDLGRGQLQSPGIIYLEIVAGGMPQPGVQCYIPGVTSTTKTDVFGRCSLQNVPPGHFDVRAEQNGFLPGTLTNVTVQSDSLTKVSPLALRFDPVYPPPAPTGLVARANRQKGLVTLSWNRVELSDLKGYRVYRKDSASSLLDLQSDGIITDSFFVDSVYTDTYDRQPRLFGYKVTVVDSSDESSLFSAVFTLRVLPPNIPASPSPSDKMENVPLAPVLAWSEVVADGGNAGLKVVYDVYLDTILNPEKLLTQGQSRNWIPLSFQLNNTKYFWKVVARFGNSEIRGPVWNFSTGGSPVDNALPITPAVVQPEHNALNQNAVSVLLQWQGGDVDIGDQVKYDVYLSTDSNPGNRVGVNLSRTFLEISGLENGVNYYWKVVASDGKATVEGPVWKFTTRAIDGQNKSPDKPSEPYPLSGSQGMGLSVHLAWTGSDPDNDKLSYEIRLSGDQQFSDSKKVASGISSTFFELTGLDADAMYYWQVISSDGEAAAKSDIWNFRTRQAEDDNQAPHIPSTPTPVSGVPNQELSVLLSWSGGDSDSDMVSYNLLFGKENPPLSVIKSNQFTTLYKVSALQPATTYFWQIIASDGMSRSLGPVWSFHTKDKDSLNIPPLRPENVAPVSGASAQNSALTLSWSGGDPDVLDEVRYDVRLGVSNPPLVSLANEQKESSLDVNGLALGVTYYWQVLASDGKDVVSSEVWSFSVKEPAIANLPPDVPSSPSPIDKSLNVTNNLTLQWQGKDTNAGDLVVYEIYLDTVNPPVFLWDTVKQRSTYSLESLEENMTYYWRIIARDQQYATSGAVWQFTTRFEPKMVAYWDCDDGETDPKVDTLSDGSGYNNIGRISGDNWMWYTGKLKKSIKFLGDKTQKTIISLPVSRSLTMESFSISMWLKDWTGQPAPLLMYTGKDNDGNKTSGLQLWLNRDIDDKAVSGSLYMDVGRSVNGEPRVIGVSQILTADFNHLMFTYNSATGMAEIFVNGKSKVKQELAAEGAATNLDTIYMGTRPEYLPALFAESNLHAAMDELKIFNYSIDAEEVNKLYNFYEQNANKAPDKPSSPTPSDEAGGVQTELTLSWEGGDPDNDAVSYEIKLDTVNPPEQYLTTVNVKTYSLNELKGNTTYYWRIKARDASEYTWGPVWKFTTANRAPDLPHTPFPTTNSVDVDTSITLSWAGGDMDSDGLSYHVFLAASEEMFTEVQTTEQTSCLISNLRENTHYSWRIVSDDGSVETTGPLWHFTTRTYPKRVAYYAFERPENVMDTTRVLYDSSGLGNHGVFEKANWVPGKNGSAMKFTGLEKVTVPINDPSLQLQSFSVAAWIRPENPAMYLPIIYGANKEGKNDHGSHIVLNYQGGNKLLANNLYVNLTALGGVNRYMSTQQNTLPGGQWSHIAVTFDIESGEVKMYINGELEQSGVVSKERPNFLSSFCLGWLPEGASSVAETNFIGLMDEFMIFNYAISEEAVKNYFGID